MSWISHNYHKVLFGVSLAAAAGLVYSASASSQELKETYHLATRPHNKDTGVPGIEKAESVIKSARSAHTLQQQKVGDRPVDLFTSVDLVVRKGQADKALDLKTEAAIHEPIPNQWWIDNGIDPGWGDASQRDEDKDGFSNLEEFTAKTSPTNPAEYPALINKLRVASVEKFSWRPLFNSIFGDGEYQFRYEDSAGKENRMSAGDTVDIGGTFFKEAPAKGRFKLLEIESREEKSSTGLAEREYVIIEDQAPNKKGQTYELPYRLNAAEKADGVNIYYDYTVIFTLEAIGEGGKEIKVEEKQTFALPSGAKEKNYKLLEVKADEKGKATSVVVEFKQGEKTENKEIPVSAK